MLKNIVIHLMQHESNGMIYFKTICMSVHTSKKNKSLFKDVNNDLICLNTMFHFQDTN